MGTMGQRRGPLWMATASLPLPVPVGGDLFSGQRFEAGFFLDFFFGSVLPAASAGLSGGDFACNFSNAAREMVGILGIVYPEIVS